MKVDLNDVTEAIMRANQEERIAFFQALMGLPANSFAETFYEVLQEWTAESRYQSQRRMDE